MYQWRYWILTHLSRFEPLHQRIPTPSSNQFLCWMENWSIKTSFSLQSSHPSHCEWSLNHNETLFFSFDLPVCAYNPVSTRHSLASLEKYQRTRFSLCVSSKLVTSTLHHRHRHHINIVKPCGIMLALDNDTPSQPLRLRLGLGKSRPFGLSVDYLSRWWRPAWFGIKPATKRPPPLSLLLLSLSAFVLRHAHFRQQPQTFVPSTKYSEINSSQFCCWIGFPETCRLLSRCRLLKANFDFWLLYCVCYFSSYHVMMWKICDFFAKTSD